VGPYAGKRDGIEPVITRWVDAGESVGFGMSRLLIDGNAVRVATTSALRSFEQ
jgi:hypothetical protein